MLRSQFEEDLEKLHNQFYAMGQEVLSQINRTVRAFVTHDRDLAKEVIEDDAEVNEYEVKLEKKSFEMIALQQPVSQDLRTVLTVLKAVSDVERMGDHAVSIAEATIRMKGEQRIPSVEEEIKIIQDIMIMSDIQLNLNNNFVTKPIGLQEWTITMILKELTNNIIKHSKANKCDIILDESNNNYTITAKDNGCGFEILTGSELASIRERIKVVDGKIEILSKKEPTIIRVTISKDN